MSNEIISPMEILGSVVSGNRLPRTIAEDHAVSVSTVRRRLDDLVVRGYVERVAAPEVRGGPARRVRLSAHMEYVATERGRAAVRENEGRKVRMALGVPRLRVRETQERETDSDN